MQMDDDTVAELIDKLKRPEYPSRWPAVEMLGQAGRRVVPPLIAVFRRGNREAWWNAGIALSKIGEPAVPDLIAALSSPTNTVRYRATWTLSQIPDSRAVEPLLTVLADADSDIRRIAAIALGRLKDSVRLPG